jgi:uncharacterized protein YebE (UPF0316 family)
MTTTVAITTLLIVLARIVDMSLDTVRTVAIVQGRRLFAASLGFAQALIYICAIAKVLQDLSHPTYALAYALGFALGTYLGIVVEERLAFGTQVISLFTRKGGELAKSVRAAGYRVAQVHQHLGVGGEEPMSILYVELPRRRVQLLIRDAAAIDENCFCVVNDVRMAGYAAPTRPGASPAPATQRS